MKRQQRHKIITNRPDRQNVRKIHGRNKRDLIKPYGKKPTQAPA